MTRDHSHLASASTRTLAVAALLLLAACVATPGNGAHPDRTVSGGDRFAIDVGEAVAVSSGGRIDYLSLVSDSRCPPDAQCVWAGVAEIALRWTAEGAAPEDFTLATQADGASHRIGRHVLRLESLEGGAAPRALLFLATAD